MVPQRRVLIDCAGYAIVDSLLAIEEVPFWLRIRESVEREFTISKKVMQVTRMTGEGWSGGRVSGDLSGLGLPLRAIAEVVAVAP